MFSFTDPDSRVRRRRTLGLEPWLFALLWAGVGFLAIVMMLASSGSEPLEDIRKEHDLALLEEFRGKDAAIKVAIIGNSKLRYGTLPEAEMEAAAAAVGLDVAFLRLLSNDAVFKHFDYALDPLLEEQPDILLIQAPLLIRERVGSNSRLHFFQQYIRWRLIGGTLQGVDPRQIQHDLTCSFNVGAQIHKNRRERIDRERGHQPGGENSVAAAEFVGRARELGIHVVAVTAPVTDRLQEYLDALGDVQMIREHAASLTASSWFYATPLADRMFCDPVHLAPEGRRMYTDWLIAQISRWRKEDPGLSQALQTPAANP